MERIEGGSSNMWDCLGVGISGVALLGSLLTASGPIGWGLFGIGAIGFVIAVARNPTVCEN